VERKDGNFHGEPYTHVQRRIRYNHLALCDKARAGAQATLRLDADDAIMVEIGQDESGSPRSPRRLSSWRTSGIPCSPRWTSSRRSTTRWKRSTRS
jgi:hypothetical protein